MTKRVDWREVREAFVIASPPVGYSELASRFGCARETIARRASREDWPAQKSLFDHQTVTLSREKASVSQADYLARQVEDAAQLRQLARKTLDQGKRLNATDARLMLALAARLEHQALDAESEVLRRLEVEGREAVEMLLAPLGEEVYSKVLDVWAADWERRQCEVGVSGGGGEVASRARARKNGGR